MIKDITLTNSCSVILNNSCFKVVKNNIYNYNKMWGKNYSLNDIKSIEFKSTGFTIRFSNSDSIFIHYDEFEL